MWKTKMLWRKLGSKLILNRPKTNSKNPPKKISKYYLASSFKKAVMLRKFLFDWSTNVSQSVTDYIKFSSETQWRLVTGVCKICPTYTKSIIVRLHPHRVKEECPMDGKCQSMVAGFSVTYPEPWKIYFGLAEGKWKKRYYNHKKSFNHKRYSHERTLSSYVCQLKETLDVTPNLKWSVVRCATPYSNTSKKCLLCLYEKLVMTTCLKQYKLLNKRAILWMSSWE